MITKKALAFVPGLIFLIFTNQVFAERAMSSLVTSTVNASVVPEIKSTPLKLYLTSQDAFKLLKKKPDILFIDVRDPVEISQTGRPEPVDAIVPVKVQTNKFDQKLNEYALEENPWFLESMEEMLRRFGKTKHDTLIVTCGSGIRSALAVRRLSKAGYTNVWHIADGYEGDERPGRNLKNAWKLAGLPWSNSSVPGSEWIMLLSK